MFSWPIDSSVSLNKFWTAKEVAQSWEVEEQMMQSYLEFLPLRLMAYDDMTCALTWFPLYLKLIRPQVFYQSDANQLKSGVHKNLFALR